MPISQPFLETIEMLQKSHQSNKDSWFWWIFFPSQLGNALVAFNQSDSFEFQIQASIQIYAAIQNLYFFQKYLFSIIR